ALNVVDPDEGHTGGEAQAFGVGEPDQQRPDQPGSHGDGDGRKVLQAGGGAKQGFANHRHDGAQVLARGQLRDHSAVLAVHRDLRGHHAREHGVAAPHHGGGGFIAGGFDAENTHYSYLSAGSVDSRMRRSMETLTGPLPRRTPKFSRPDAFQTQRSAERCSSSRSGRAGCPGSRVSSEKEVVLTMMVNSSFRS